MNILEWIDWMERLRTMYNEGAITPEEYLQTAIAKACEVPLSEGEGNGIQDKES